MRYDVVIIGAGAAGFGCALTLGSANDKFDWALTFSNRHPILGLIK